MPMVPTAEELREENIADLFPPPSTHPTTSATTSLSLQKETPSLLKERKKKMKAKKQAEADVGV